MGGDVPAAPANTTSTTTQELPLYARPSAQALLARGNALSNRPYIPYRGARVAQINPTIQQAGTGINTAITQALPSYSIARSTAEGLASGTNPFAQSLNATAAGDYLSPSTNPFISDVYDVAARDVVENYQNAIAPSTTAAAARAGALGGSAFDEQTRIDQYGLGRNLSDLATDIYSRNYEAERQRQIDAANLGANLQLQGAQLIPGLSASQQAIYDPLFRYGEYVRGLGQQNLDLAYANFREAQDQPYRNLDVLGSTLAQSIGRGGVTTVTQPYFGPQFSPLAGVAGGALTGYGLTNSAGGAIAGGLLGGLAG